VAAIFVLWLFTAFLALNLDGTRSGQFGDAFGAINALFSGLAFVGLVFAILLQRIELKLQREELTETRIELAGSRKAQEAQNDFIERQIFESTFFQLLRELSDIVEAMDFRDRVGNQTSKGRDVIAVLYERYSRRLRRAMAQPTSTGDLETAISTFDAFYAEHGNEFGHYFRTIYNILKYIDRSAPGNEIFYAHILRAQFSNIECNMLLYDSLSTPGKKILRYVNKYHLLKHCDESRLVLPNAKALHEKSAFEDEDNEGH
jgi:hypothetical protein